MPSRDPWREEECGRDYMGKDRAAEEHRSQVEGLEKAYRLACRRSCRPQEDGRSPRGLLAGVAAAVTGVVEEVAVGSAEKGARPRRPVA